MARRPIPEYVDTVIIGGGPASLILSYILHGHVPYYNGKHHDALLHSKLTDQPNLLNITPDTFAHFYSSLRYSTQALPLNTLLDTLIRPNADTEINPESCVEWSYEPDRAVSHVIFTSEPQAGGQWVVNTVAASWDIGTLSYSEMLSLPDYSYADHYRLRHGIALPDFERPSRTEAADYFATYPRAAGLTTEFFPSTKVSSVLRTDCGFHIDPHNIHCKHLVLATGIFSFTIGPPAVLAPIAALDNPDEALLVIGSGFSAADVIISAPMNRKIVHIFKWNPETKPSPLRGCHHQAYPEYAGVYRQMKLAAVSSRNPSQVTPQMIRRKSNPFFRHRDWAGIYEGFPNAEILEVDIRMKKGLLRIRLETGEVVERVVGDLAYVVGRRGTLDYLDQSLRTEVLGASTAGNNVKPLQNLISGRTLRAKVEKSFEVAPDVFVVGSLAGDSLVRHAFGGCVSVASTIMNIGSGNGDKGNSHRSFMKRSELDSNGLASNGTAHEDLHVHRHQELTT